MIELGDPWDYTVTGGIMTLHAKRCYSGKMSLNKNKVTPVRKYAKKAVEQQEAA
jgi:hypothetical protein